MRPRTKRDDVAPRDQSESPFAVILSALLGRVPGARAAALVDAVGETVDYAGAVDPYEIRVAAAHWRIVLRDTHDQAALGRPVSVTIRADRASFVIRSLPDGYAIVLLLARQATALGGTRAMAACAELLGKEAGWAPGAPPSWYPVDVVSDPTGRPNAVTFAGATESLDVLGRFADRRGSRERAWRVRLSIGAEATLVREPGGFWYADEHLEQCAGCTAVDPLSHDVQKSR